MASAGETQAGSETDRGPRGTETERLCVVTREVKPVSAMIRFVPAPDGSVAPDIKRRLPGRGVWVTARRDILGEAVRRNAFARSLKRPVRVGPELVTTTEALLAQAVLDMVAMANKAGFVVPGFTKVEAALGAGRVVALLQAAEASPDGVRKILGAGRRGRDPNEPDLPILVFENAHLDLALGRTNVIHAALLAGAASEAVLARHRLLQAFGGNEASPTPKADE